MPRAAGSRRQGATISFSAFLPPSSDQGRSVSLVSAAAEALLVISPPPPLPRGRRRAFREKDATSHRHVRYTIRPSDARWYSPTHRHHFVPPTDCVLLECAARRFGNGDGVCTQAEYQKAFGAWYDLLNAPNRIGAEIVF